MTISKADVPILAGPHVLRLAMDSIGANNSVGNFNWIRLVAMTISRPEVFLQAAEAVTGPYVDVPGALTDPAAATIAIPIPAAERFYRLRSTTPSRITGVQVGNSSIIFGYE
jgi:fructose-specific component phosphotransferase system IIB-like protein